MCLDKTVTASLRMEQQLCMNMRNDQKLKEAKLLLTQTLYNVFSIQRLYYHVTFIHKYMMFYKRP